MDTKECRHENWEVRDDCLIGCGYCLDCDKEIYLSVLFNGLKQRMDEALEKLKSRLGKLD